MAAIITDNFRIDNADLFRQSFSSNNYYMALGRSTPWTGTLESPVADDTNPPNPSDSLDAKAQIWREMIGAKKIQTANVSLMIPRINWESGVIYDVYDSGDNALFQKNFYAITDEYNVYKVIGNAGGDPSTVKPTGNSTSIVTTGDGYRWKFMYTLSTTQATNFLTPQFMPISPAPAGSDQEVVQIAAIPGQIVSYKVIDGGVGYSSSPSVTVIGDGTGATATAVVSGGAVVSVDVTGLGLGYTYASVVIAGGTGAIVQANTAPPGGHGADAVYELGAYYVALVARLEYGESGNITTENDYRQISIVRGPSQYGTAVEYTSALARQTTRLTVVDAIGFITDEMLSGTSSGATASIVEVDTDNNYVYISNIKGTFTNEPVTGFDSTHTTTVSAINDPAFQPYTGHVLYTETRKPIARDTDQVERIITIIEW